MKSIYSIIDKKTFKSLFKILYFLARVLFFINGFAIIYILEKFDLNYFYVNNVKYYVYGLLVLVASSIIVYVLIYSIENKRISNGYKVAFIVFSICIVCSPLAFFAYGSHELFETLKAAIQNLCTIY